MKTNKIKNYAYTHTERERVKSKFSLILNLIRSFYSNGVKIILTSLFAALVCAGVIYAATTIGTNISTDGNLTTGGANIFSGSLTTSGANTFYGATSIGGALTATSTLNVTGLTTLGNASTSLLSVISGAFLATTTIAANGDSVFLIEKSDGTDIFKVDSAVPSIVGIGRGASYTVCASDTINKKGCDYIADGTNDGEQIMSAHNALPSGGGKIILLDGIYDIRSSNIPIISKSNVILEGAGKSTHLKANGTAARQVGYIIDVTGDNVIVRNMWLDGNAIDANDTYAIHGIVFDTGANYCKAENLWINDIGGDGIVFYDDDNVATGNVVYDLTGTSGAGGHCNWGESCTAFEVEDGADRVIFSNNIASNVNECYQPHVHGAAPPVTGLIFSNNICIASGVQEAYIKFANDGTTGASDVTITNNILVGGYIRLTTDTTGATSSVLIANNTITTTNETGAIYLTGSANNPDMTVRIQGNRISNASGAGISFDAISALIVDGNHIEDTTTSGITIANSNASRTSDVTITNNLIENTATASGNAVFFGPSAANINRLLVANNKLINTTSGKGGAGFSISAAGSTNNVDFIGNLVVGNNITTSGYAGLVFNAQSNTIKNFGSANPAVNIGGNTSTSKIAYNVIDTGSNAAVYMVGDNFDISHNFITNITYANVLSIDAGAINGNIANNIITGQVSTGATDYAIVVGGDENIVSNNTLIGASDIENGIRVLAGADDVRLLGNNVDSYGSVSSVQVVNLGTNTYMRGNFGYTSGYRSDNGGATSVADGGTVAHGLGVTPTYGTCTPSVADHICQITAKDATNLTIGLINSAGTAIAVAETIYWEAVK